MKKQGRQASTGLGVSFSNFAASVMKATEVLLISEKRKANSQTNIKDIENFEEKWKEVYFDLAMKLQPNASTFDATALHVYKKLHLRLTRKHF